MNAPLATVTSVIPEVVPEPEIFAEKIITEWRKSVEAIIAVGRLLSDAKAQLNHGDLGRLSRLLPFSSRTDQMV